MIGEGNAHRLWRLHVGQQAQKPAHRLADGVVTWLIGARPEIAKAGDRAPDQARIGRLALFVAEVEPLQRPGAEIFHDDVGSGDQLARSCLPRLGLEIEHDALLVAVHRAEGGAVVDRAPAAEGIAMDRRLDLDDLGAEIGEQHARIGSADIARELNDANTLEGTTGRNFRHHSSQTSLLCNGNYTGTSWRAMQSVERTPTALNARARSVKTRTQKRSYQGRNPVTIVLPNGWALITLMM